jgi:hypothetical protein
VDDLGRSVAGDDLAEVAGWVHLISRGGKSSIGVDDEGSQA